MNKSFRVKVALRRRSVLKLYKVFRVTKLRVMTDSIEFYSKLWEIISEPFLNCVNEI